ncbi:MAG: peptidylprolyl isomerase [Burkholderiaceae bacterium]|nr:peptidylprolyl isomerase [Burkholderiaceae bacterium]
MNKLLSTSTVLAAAVLIALPAAAQNIAIVNGKTVPKARVDALMEQILKQGQQRRTPELEAQVRDEVVLREMFVQEAEKRGFQSKADYKVQMEFARQTILIRELFTQYQATHPVTEAEIQAEYAKSTGAAGTEYRARHILVDTEDQAKALIAQIKAGAKFEDVAKKDSKDTGSGENGGDLDFASPSVYVPEFGQAMVKLQKGEMTEQPVKSQFGWHIIRLEDTRAAQAPSLAEVRPQIEQKLGQLKIAKFRDDIRAKYKTDYKFTN